MPIPDDLDQQIRTAAFIQVRRMLELRDPLTSDDLKRGFTFQGERIPLINPQRGIFKPTQMKYALSIKTVVPRKGARIWYDDQKTAHNQIYKGDETVAYSFMGTNPESADNRWLREAMENRIPLIYFLGAFPGHYHAIIPVTIVGWDARALQAQVSMGLPGEMRADPQETRSSAATR